jgi:SAM-dependent methyltransferase
MSLDAVRQSYDETPYQDRPLLYLHPDLVGTTASLFGLDPAPADRCRVLEIGCASGVNLLAMAQYLPGSRFVGIDLSPVQVAAGKDMAAAAGIPNVALHACAVGDLPADAGQFDYVLCHGVYSWVPPHVRGEILAAVKRHLAPGGVGYVSYNTLPGWHAKRVVLDLVQYAGRKGQGGRGRLEAGFGFLRFLLDSLPASEAVYSRTLQQLGRPLLALLEKQPSYLLHEYLDEFNTPVYFHEFAAALAGHGLQYVAEVTPAAALAVLPPAVKKAVTRWADDRTEAEQALDFCIGPTFRRSLVCHAEVRVSQAPPPEVMRRYRYSVCARPAGGPRPLDAQTSEEFEILWKDNLSTANALLKAIAYALGEAFPRSLDFTELHRAVAAKLAALPDPGPVVGEGGEGPFAAGLLAAYRTCFLRPHRWAPPVAAAVPERPRAAAFNRHAGPSLGPVANPYHMTITVGDFERVVLGLCDGSRDRTVLAAALEAKVRAGEFGPGPDVPVEDVVASLPGCVDDCLSRLQENGLLLPGG